MDDLAKVDGKAELIGGRIVRFMPSGHKPVRVAFKIAMSLETWSAAAAHGVVYTDGIGYAIRPPLASGRQTFSPAASFDEGPLPPNEMKFIEGPPLLAVEVRSENDYSQTAEREIAAKRADYFEAGTKVVWDVDPVAQLVRSFRSDAPQQPLVFRLGNVAEAEPALPGWRLAVAEIFS